MQDEIPEYVIKHVAMMWISREIIKPLPEPMVTYHQRGSLEQIYKTFS